MLYDQAATASLLKPVPEGGKGRCPASGRSLARFAKALQLRRGEAVRTGKAKPPDFRDRANPEPEASRKVLANLANQFELPMLFHIGCIALFVTGGISFVVVAVAWVFVVSRYVHTAIHVGANRLRYRFPAFMVGFAATAFLWLWLALHLAGVV